MAGFSGAAAADVASGVASAISAWGTASANKIVAKANAEAMNTVRKAQNQQRASSLTLAGAMRAQSYRASLTNAGEASNSATELIARHQDAWTRGNFEQGLKGAEEMGAYAARAAAAGVGGASVAAVSYTVRLQQSRLAEQTTDRQSQMQYELVKQRSGIMPAAISRLDNSPLAAGLDQNDNYVPSSSSGGNLLGALAEGLMSKSKSLQVMLDSIPKADETQLSTGDFARMDRNWQVEAQSPIQIN